MTESSHFRDELAGGSPRDPVRVPRAVRVAGLCVAGALVAWTAVSGNPRAEPDAAGDPAPTLSSPSALTTWQVFPSQPGPLGIDAVCPRTDRRRLSVGVDLTNGGLTRLTLLSASSVLPVGGLSPRAEVLPAVRTCDGRPRAQDGLVMRPGGILPVRLQLGLPERGCPDGSVVQVEVTFLGAGERPMTQRLTLLRDLTGLGLESCADA